MGGCSAINCTNHSRKGHKMFSFPLEITRRRKWAANCMRDSWTPRRSAQLCIDHFDESQFERNRKDGWKKLKQLAVPTLFNFPVPNFPDTSQTLGPKQSKGLGTPTPDSPCLKIKTEPIFFEETEFELHEQDTHYELHEQETQFELQQEDDWKKLKPNAIPTLFPDLSETSNVKIGIEVSPQKRLTRSSTQNSQKQNVSPVLRRSSRPCGVAMPISDSAPEEELNNDIRIKYEEESNVEDEALQQIELLKRENEAMKQENMAMKQEISEFEDHNKAMAGAILELEKHNKLMSMKFIEIHKVNKVITKKLSDLERQNKDLKSKLNCSLSEKQFTRMYTMRHLGKFERYTPVFKLKIT